MAAKMKKRAGFIAKRVRALAIMYLTRRDDLLVEEDAPELSHDLIVRFRPKDKEGARQFGVVVRGAWESVSKEQAEKVLRPFLQKIKRRGPRSFPTCLFFFTMKENQGWYAWVAEPVVTTDGKPRLRMHEHALCQPLNKAAVNDLVAQVDWWFDAFYGTLITEEVR